MIQLLIASLPVLLSAAPTPDEHHRYCLVGAGPAGVQMGHYLQETNRDFVLLERTPRAAFWFSKFPVHRVLNSINRRFTRRDNLEFNLRHDWNSLLGAEKTVGLFGTWSHEYWPSADTIVEYINAFAKDQVDAGKLQFNQDVKSVTKCKSKGPGPKDPCRYLLTVETGVGGSTKQSVNLGGLTADMGANESGTCASTGKCKGVADMEGVTTLVKKIAGLEACVRNGNFDIGVLKDLITSKEELGNTIGSSSSEFIADGGKEKAQEKPTSRTISCSVLVMTNGMMKPREVDDWIHGLEAVKTEYEELQGVERNAFENRSVIILGAGNAATETADFVRSVSRDIQVVGRYTALRKMGESHYVGDVRVRRTTHEDAFYMKSYEGVHAVPFRGTIMVPCGPDKDNLGFQGKPPVCVFLLEQSMDETVLLASVDEANKDLIQAAVKAFGDGVFIRDASPAMKRADKLAVKLKLSFKTKLSKVLCITKKELMKELNLEQRQLLIPLRDASAELVPSGEEFRKPYDVVITALGWHYDQSIFKAGDVKMKMTGPVSKERAADVEVYPGLTGEFESTNNKHIFVAGAAAHGIDRYRYKGSGGFIHGFRFNCRTLVRILEERYEAADHPRNQPIAMPQYANGWLTFPWNFNNLPKLHKDDEKMMTGIRENLGPMWSKLMDRINDAAGPYEMVGGSLVDSIIFDCKKKESFYLEDLTEDMLHERYHSHPRISWGYYYGYFHRPNPAHLCGLRSASAGVFSAFIHPVLQYFPAGLKGGPGGKTFSQTHQKKYFDMLNYGAIAKLEHPSSVWEVVDGISRLHIMEAYIFGDWGDSKAIRQVEVFMSHIENAAAQFCKKEGPGKVERKFDEVIDVNLDHPDFKEDFLKKHTKQVCGEILPQG